MEKIICPFCGHSATRRKDTISVRYRCNNRLCLKTFKPDNVSSVDPQKQKKMPSQIGLTSDQLRAKYDNKFIISEKAKTLKKDIFLTESQFKATCNFSGGAGYRDALNDPDFTKYRGKASGGIVYWGHPDSIDSLKNEGILKDS